MRIARFYIREVDTKRNVEASFYDSKFVSLEDTSLFKIFKDFFKAIKHYSLHKLKIESDEFLNAVEYNAEKIYDERNEWLVSQGYPKVEYKEYFDEMRQIKKIPTYIQ